MLEKAEQHFLGLTEEMEAPVIPLLEKESILEVIERYNKARKLPHLTIIDSFGGTVHENALDLLLKA